MTVEKLLDIATQEIGYLEKSSNSQLDDKTANSGYGNFTKYGRDTAKWGLYNGNKSGFAWCEQFVDWCFIKAEANGREVASHIIEKSMQSIYQPLGKEGAACEFSAEYFKKNNALKKNPKIGDQIFFKNSSNLPYHTGIVVDVDEVYVTTIEGNTSEGSKVVANGGAVCRKKYKRNYERIYGYGRPQIQEESNVIYNSITDVPSWGKYVAAKDDEKGYLHFPLDESLLRSRVAAYRQLKDLGLVNNELNPINKDFAETK